MTFLLPMHHREAIISVCKVKVSENDTSSSFPIALITVFVVSSLIVETKSNKSLFIAFHIPGRCNVTPVITRDFKFSKSDCEIQSKIIIQ